MRLSEHLWSHKLAVCCSSIVEFLSFCFLCICSWQVDVFEQDHFSLRDLQNSPELVTLVSRGGEMG